MRYGCQLVREFSLDTLKPFNTEAINIIVTVTDAISYGLMRYVIETSERLKIIAHFQCDIGHGSKSRHGLMYCELNGNRYYVLER